MTVNFGRALRTRAAFQTVDFATYAASMFYDLTTYKRGDPASPDLTDDPLLGIASDNNRDAIAPQPGMPKGDVQRTVPLALEEIGMWLSVALGYPTTSGTAPNFTHIFKSGAESLPWLSVEDLIMAGVYRMHRGVVVDGISIQATKENAYPQVVLDLLMRDSVKAVAALAGDDAETQFTLQRPPAWGATVLWNDVAIGDATTATINYKNNCTRWLGLNGDEFPVSIDTGLASAGGSMTLRTSADTYHDLAASSGTGKLSLVWKMPGAAAANRSLQFDFNICRLSDSGQPIEAAGEITADYTIRAEQGTATHPMVTVTLKNGFAAYPPTPDE